MQDDGSNIPKYWFRQAPATIIGVLIFTIFSNTLYDLLVKPGITSFGRLILNIATFGSLSIKNAAYSSAALNPTPVSSLVLLQGALVLVACPAIFFISRRFSKRRISAVKNKIEGLSNEEKEQQLENEISRLDKYLNRLDLVFWICFVPLFITLNIAYSVHNQSILIWRVFNANLEILSPWITPDERLKFQAKFASMETNGDFKVIRKEMVDLAESKGIKLKNIETW